MFDKVLIANRGTVACRIIRTLRRLGVRSVAVFSEADRGSLHVAQADEAWCIGEGPAATSYLDAERILELAARSGAGAIHPGYGFLSENAAFAEACEARGIAFAGPRPEQLRAFGLKHEARALAQAAGLPMLPGTAVLRDSDEALAAAAEIGYPVMLKSSAGGGGIGMQRCEDADTLREAFESVARLARNNFGDPALFLEKFVSRARHVEVQLFGDGAGQVVQLGDRDCSLQRRNQKVVEEAPAPGLPAALRERLHASAVALGESVAYRSAGTVEYVYDAEAGECYFLEVNTRLQVEHGVTEEVYGVDLVEWMLRLAAGELPPLAALRAGLQPRGHAVQVRLYAEDPANGFRPAPGLLTEVQWPAAPVRIETWVERGVSVPPFYDPMIGKLICHAGDREAAFGALAGALQATRIGGIVSNREYLLDVIDREEVRAGRPYTRLLEGLPFVPAAVEVLEPGTLTTVQDHPGRLGYWDVGIPPSGPFDDLSFRLGNRLLGNPTEAAGLEVTLQGPSLRFHQAARIVLTGAQAAASLDGEAVAFWTVLDVPAGKVLKIGTIAPQGARAYLLVAGGLDVPGHLGSRATFTLGQMGGHGGRALRPGDMLPLGQCADSAPAAGLELEAALRPPISAHWQPRVIYGPHGAPDFFTPADIDSFFATDWEVHYNSSRTGVRLIGPRPQWARPDGGEAGLHPSNIHDNAYAIGTVDFTGDMPIILGPDGPSLGGFVCPATVIQADRWMLGQLRAGDRVRFVPVSLADAEQARLAQERMLASLRPEALPACRPAPVRDPVLRRRPAREGQPAITYRPSGDAYLLVEFGPLVLDIALRARVQAWLGWLSARRPPGIVDLTPGIRSLQIHYDPGQLPLARLRALLEEAEEHLGDIDSLDLPSRIVHLPLAWDDNQTRLATAKYSQSVRADAPWCPSNIEFIRRINGLDSVEAVRRTVYEASYLVLGLGDVYLGAPVATPLDPRHRLVTTKYNPARTWTPENAVGIGGAYLCIYGMEGPGGYQFVGRTLQMWSRYRQDGAFRDGKPWLLRFFDQIRFYPVSEEELLALRRDFPLGRHPIRIEDTRFRLADYEAFLAENHAGIEAFRHSQRQAFAEERARWAAAGEPVLLGGADDAAPVDDHEPLDPGSHAVASPVAGSVWEVATAPGQQVAEGELLVVIESMKMEIRIEAPTAGRVREVLCANGTQVHPGRRLAIIDSTD